MAPYESDGTKGPVDTEDPRPGYRRAARYVVPVAVVGVAAATIGLVPALADSGDPDLPKITAEQLVEKIAKSDVEQVSGTVKISTDLGLPDLGGLESGLLAGVGTSGDGASGDGSSADPASRLTELAAGTHTLRVAADGPDRQKLSLIESAAEYSLIHNGKDVWGYDSRSNEVYHATADQDGAAEGAHGIPATPRDFAADALKAVDGTTSVKVDGTAQVAGRDAYKLVIKPRQSGSTVGAISIAVDAKTGLPLKFTLTPASGGAAVVDAGFTQVSFAKPAASTFDFTPPKGAKVTEGDKASAKEPGGGLVERLEGRQAKGLEGKGDEGAGREGFDTLGEGWNTVAVLDTGAESAATSGAGDGDLGGFLGSFGDKVSGDFGEGTVFSTRLINALITDDGRVYVGAVTKDALVKAANSGK